MGFTRWLLMGFVAVMVTGPVTACTCRVDLDRARSLADVIFQGRIVSRSMLVWGDAVFAVTRVWKGPVAARISVEWRRGDRGDCDGFWPEHLQVGADLLVFATRGKDGIYRTSICFPTQPAAGARDIIRKLGEGRRPGPA